MKRIPITTLFMLESLDGKISSGNNDSLDILFYEELDLKMLLEDLYSKYNVDKLTIQSGENLNGLFVRENPIDYVNVVIEPLLVGGKDV